MKVQGNRYINNPEMIKNKVEKKTTVPQNIISEDDVKISDSARKLVETARNKVSDFHTMHFSSINGEIREIPAEYKCENLFKLDLKATSISGEQSAFEGCSENQSYFGPDDSMVAEVIDNTTSRGRTLRFLYDGPHDEFKKALYSLGETPLPHSIINRPVEPEDAERFQSIFAKNEGAVTAPTASLHFSRELMKRLEIKGIDFAYITLHAGLGNFRDIDVEDLTKHKMDSEQMFVNEMAVKTVNRAKDNGRNVCAVGTTVMRAIESAVSTDGHLKEFEGWTNKFIFPPYEFTVANSMISNFHMPLSTLLMIVAAFGGYDQVMDAYHVALKEGYRFGTYGDAMLILDK